MERQSILSRPRKTRSRCNEENIDAEFEREQAAFRARQLRYQETDAMLRQARGNETAEERQQRLEALQRTQENLLTHKKHSIEAARRQEIAAREAQEEYERQNAEEELSATRQRRQREHQIMLDNQRLAEERKERARREKLAEQARENRDLQVMASLKPCLR